MIEVTIFDIERFGETMWTESCGEIKSTSNEKQSQTFWFWRYGNLLFDTGVVELIYASIDIKPA